jgi:hypothetical protein
MEILASAIAASWQLVFTFAALAIVLTCILTAVVAVEFLQLIYEDGMNS